MLIPVTIIRIIILIIVIIPPLQTFAVGQYDDNNFNKHKYDLIVVGAASVDIIAFMEEEDFRKKLILPYNIKKGSMADVDKHIIEELEGTVKNAVMMPGGEAVNIVANMASLGGQVGLSSIVNDDTSGKFINHHLNLLGIINMCSIKKSEQGTDKNLIFVTPDAERTILSYRGVSMSLDQLDIHYQEIKDFKVLFVEGRLWDGYNNHSSKAVMRLFNVAEKVGVKKAFSLSDETFVSKYRDDFLKLLPRIDIIFSNEQEAFALFGSNDLETVITQYQNTVPIAVIARGDKGALIITKNKVYNIRPPKVSKDKIVDTTGAGHGFAAGFLYGYIQGFPIDECAEIAKETAARVLQQLGAWPKPITLQHDL